MLSDLIIINLKMNSLTTTMSLLNFNMHSGASSTNVFRVKGEDAGFYSGANFYSEKHGMIIACPSDNTVQFYNPTTLLPLQGRKTLQLDGSVLQISHCPETDMILLTCQGGNIYSYDLSKHLLIKEQESNERPRPRETANYLFHDPPSNASSQIAFLNSAYYAFSSAQSDQISIGKFDDVLTTRIEQESAITCLSKSEKGRFLLSGLADGSVRVHRTDQLPHLPIVCSAKDWKGAGDIVKVEEVVSKGKEYVIAAESNGTIRVWVLERGKMRLVRVIKTGDKIYWFVYLEKHQMIVTTHGKECIKFWSFASGKLKYTYYSDMIKSRDVFLMNGKNAVGIADYRSNMIEVVPLLRVNEKVK